MKIQRRFFYSFVAVSLLGFSSHALAASAQIHEVNCTSSPTGSYVETGDKDAIQNVINAAQPGDTVLIKGYCRTGGAPININKSNITIMGEVDDTPQDNFGGKKWKTTINMVTPSGPAGVGFTFPAVDNKDYSNVTIKKLRMVNGFPAIRINPSIGNTLLNTPATSCANYYNTGSTVNKLNIDDNWFIGGNRAIEHFGGSNDMTIKNNLMENMAGAIVLVNGQTLSCVLPGNVPSTIDLNTPTSSARAENLSILNNEFNNLFFCNCGNRVISIYKAGEKLNVSTNKIGSTTITGLAVFYTNNGSITSNEFGTGAPGASHPSTQIGLNNTTNFKVTNNIIQFSYFSGIVVQAENANLLINNNHINNILGVTFGGVPVWGEGITVDGASSGVSMVNNRFNDNLTDIWFSDITHDNVVNASNFATTVDNTAPESNNNRLLGTLKLLNNDNVSSDVKDKLIAEGIGRAPMSPSDN